MKTKNLSILIVAILLTCILPMCQVGAASDWAVEDFSGTFELSGSEYPGWGNITVLETAAVDGIMPAGEKYIAPASGKYTATALLTCEGNTTYTVSGWAKGAGAYIKIEGYSDKNWNNYTVVMNDTSLGSKDGEWVYFSKSFKTPEIMRAYSIMFRNKGTEVLYSNLSLEKSDSLVHGIDEWYHYAGATVKQPAAIGDKVCVEYPLDSANYTKFSERAYDTLTPGQSYVLSFESKISFKEGTVTDPTDDDVAKMVPYIRLQISSTDKSFTDRIDFKNENAVDFQQEDAAYASVKDNGLSYPTFAKPVAADLGQWKANSFVFTVPPVANIKNVNPIFNVASKTANGILSIRNLKIVKAASTISITDEDGNAVSGGSIPSNKKMIVKYNYVPESPAAEADKVTAIVGLYKNEGGAKKLIGMSIKNDKVLSVLNSEAKIESLQHGMYAPMQLEAEFAMPELANGDSYTVNVMTWESLSNMKPITNKYTYTGTYSAE